MMMQGAYAAAYEGGLQTTIRLLLSRGLMLEDAEEVAQAAWARGWEARQQLKSEDRVVPWVNSIAMHTMCNNKRRGKKFDALDERRHDRGSAIPLHEKIDADRLLSRCSALDRSLMIHRYSGGFDMEGIARIHGLTCAATRVRIHRAKAALRREA